MKDKTMPINIPGMNFPLSKASAKTLGVVEKRVKEWNELEAAYQQDAERFRSMSLDDSPPNFTEIGSELKQRRIQLLIQEIGIRSDMDDFLNMVKADRLAAYEAACEAFLQAEAKVLSGLLALGYVEGVVPGTNNLCITRGMIQVNPNVYQARILRDSLQDTDFVAVQQSNATRVSNIRIELEKSRAAALTGV